MAGIRFEKIPIPNEKDIAQVNKKNFFNKLVDVENDVVSTFKQTAQELVMKHNGD
jgi:hypothetical protein